LPNSYFVENDRNSSELLLFCLHMYTAQQVLYCDVRATGLVFTVVELHITLQHWPHPPLANDFIS